MLPTLGTTAVHVELTEVCVAENLSIGTQGLLDDFASVCDEEEPGEDWGFAS